MGKTVHISGFPQLISASVVKEFLESYTGQGTIDALEVKRSKQGPRPYVRVQFVDSQCAERIISLTNSRLYFGKSYLKAREMEIDMIRVQKGHMHEMKEITLNFGCQISREVFSVMWTGTCKSVKFGTGMKKMCFQLCFNSNEYKLQLSYENIWQIVLYHPNGLTAKLLVIQLFGAPRIYKKANHNIYNYYKEISDDQWIRTTDFTSSCIGQSSALCLQLPYGMKVPNFHDSFPYYMESEDPFYLRRGAPFTPASALVPILHPPRGHELPYRILFKICRLVQTGCLPGPNIDADFYRLVSPQRYDIKFIEHTLEELYYLKECCYDPVTWFHEQYRNYARMRNPPKSPAICLDDGLVYVHRVQVTPAKVYFSGPEANMSNRVLRYYRDDIDNFIRVSFVDEEWDKMYSTDLTPKITPADGNRRTKIYERILSTLRDGIRIGDKKFDFLAFSSSQLRDNSVWMFAPTSKHTADDIREWMGDFSAIRNVAKYAARLGQSFGSSTEALSVGWHEVERIPDITILSNGKKYVFSDGIGKISYDFAKKIALKCNVGGSVPSVFQIRYGGYKGVVAIDPSSRRKLSLRPSMLKYESVNEKLDVLAWSKYQPCYLNRQIITLLSSLGIGDNVFEKKQRKAVAQLNNILVDPLRAREALDLMAPGENSNILKEMLECGYKPDGEPFLSMMLQTFRASKLLDLKLKARIFVPKARQMMGCLDETGALEYGQVFVQFSSSFNHDSLLVHDKESEGYKYLVKGKVAVAKNPCLHPGDVRVLEAIDVPALHHMVDCVVFPQKGMRPHPNECSGSDLDGDIYFVCWDLDLIPTISCQPMDYSPAPEALLDHDVTIEDVEEYFTNYIVNDTLGVIANAHTVFADKEPEMAMSSLCIQLAELFSVAVDFPKTGIPAEIPSHLRVNAYPDFMEKPDKATYESKRVIGKLFRGVKDIAPAPNSASIKSFTKQVAQSSYDPEMEVHGFEEYIDDAFEYKTVYDYKLGNLMEYYGIKTEAELLSGSIMKMAKTFDRKKDPEAIAVAVKSLRNEARSWFKKGNETDDIYAKASAWYHVTYHPDYWGRYNKGFKRDHYLSFPWCIYAELIKIKKDNKLMNIDKYNSRKSTTMPSLEDQFSRLYH